MRTTTTLVLATFVATFGLTQEPSNHQWLTILHTSDLHGAVLPVDDLRDAPAEGSLAQVATVVERVRSEVDHPVLVFDSGDTIQGTPLELFALVRWGEASPTVWAMSRIGYSAMAVGNHEFNFGLEVLRRAESEASFPFLSANVVDEATGEPAFTPYVVFEVGAVRVGVLGLTTPNIPGWELPEHYRGLGFVAMDTAAREWVGRLRSEEACDLVVVLAHTGFEAAGRGNPEDFAARLSALEGIDLLLTGHTHRDIAPHLLADTIVAQPAARARLVTRLDLELELVDGAWRLASWQGVNLPTRPETPDRALVAELEPLHDRVREALDAPVATVTGPLSVHGCRRSDCAALDLIHAVQLDVSGAELSMAAILSDRTPDLPPGGVSWRWIHSLYVYPNTLVVVRLTGTEVKDVLEHSARYHAGLDCDPGGACTLLTDPAVRRYNVDTMAGIDYTVDPTAPAGDRVRDLRWQGRPLDLHRSFTVVCNNYRAAGGGGFPHLATAPVEWSSPQEMVDLIGDYLARHDPWSPRPDGNWALAPEVMAERPLSSRQ